MKNERRVHSHLFVLTPEEKRVVAFIMLMIVVGVCVKEYRKRYPVPPPPIEVQKHPWMKKPLPSPAAAASTRSGVQDALATPRAKRSRKSRKRSPTATPAEQQSDSASADDNQLR
jgi:hypothetical protein